MVCFTGWNLVKEKGNFSLNFGGLEILEIFDYIIFYQLTVILEVP